jgi:hypothetical protein
MTRLIWIVGCLMASSDRRRIARGSGAGRGRTPRDLAGFYSQKSDGENKMLIPGGEPNFGFGAYRQSLKDRGGA